MIKQMSAINETDIKKAKDMAHDNKFFCTEGESTPLKAGLLG